MTDLAEALTADDSPLLQPVSQSYLLCATPRTGSYLLADLLRRTERAGNPTEYFSDGFQRYWMPRWGVDTYDAYLQQVQQAGTTTNGVLAVKAHPRQLRHFARQETGDDAPSWTAARGAVDRWLPRCRYIWLRRRDQLRQAVSWAKSMQTNVWWDAPVPPAPYDEPVPDALRFGFGFLTAALIRMRREDGMWQRFFAANELQPLQIWYEDLAADPIATCRAALEYLELSDVPVPTDRSSFRRQSDAVSERWIRRYPALEFARFEATYSAMANVDDGADFLVAHEGFERPDGWDESRHSLLVTDGYEGPFKPDYRLAYTPGPPAPNASADADVRFVLNRPSASSTRDVVLPREWLESCASGPTDDALTHGAAMLAAHLGADRVGIPVPGSRGEAFDIGRTRVLLLDDSDHGLGVDGFLRLPPRPQQDLGRQHAALRIAILTGADPAPWMRALRTHLVALTKHHCTLVSDADTLAETPFDVAICVTSDDVAPGRILRCDGYDGYRLVLRAGDCETVVPRPAASRLTDFVRDWDLLWSPLVAVAMAT